MVKFLILLFDFLNLVTEGLNIFLRLLEMGYSSVLLRFYCGYKVIIEVFEVIFVLLGLIKLNVEVYELMVKLLCFFIGLFIKCI